MQIKLQTVMELDTALCVYARVCVCVCVCVRARGQDLRKVSNRTNGLTRDFCSFMKIKLQWRTINETYLMSVKL